MSQFKLFSEDKLLLKYETDIQSFWHNSVQTGGFQGVAGVNIAYAFMIHPHAVGTVVISSGRIESFIKYKEVVYDLHQNGYSVFIHDHRGQGLSGRLLENSHIGFVESFDEYVADFKTFIDEIVAKQTQHQPKLLCHSMGGAIGALTILRYPDLFEKVAFSAPMFGIRPSLPSWFANLLLSVHAILHAENSYFFGQKNYAAHAFIDNELTHSEIRYQIFRQEYQAFPKAQLGGVSGHWLKVAAQAMDEIEQNIDRFPILALVIQAGADQIVDNKRQSRVVEKMANSTFKIIEGAKHELLEEKDEFRVDCLTAILDFYRN